MHEYLQLVRETLLNGTYHSNIRTDEDAIRMPSAKSTYDIAESLPLVTTKDMLWENIEGKSAWGSICAELEWFLSGQSHIREFKQKSTIWNDWADENDNLEMAYGRFWRRYPLPDPDTYEEGETWPDRDHRWVNDDGETFDQIQRVVDMLKENPHSRRIKLTAWHPANAAFANPPPCHGPAQFLVIDGRLEVILQQRSGDIALGVPFNIASYALLGKVLAKEAGLKPARLHHHIGDAHIYCGRGERGQWYEEKLPEVRQRCRDDSFSQEQVADWIEQTAPPDPDTKDHVPGLLRQLSRESYAPPTVKIDAEGVDDLTAEDITLQDYDHHDMITFGIAV